MELSTERIKSELGTDSQISTPNSSVPSSEPNDLKFFMVIELFAVIEEERKFEETSLEKAWKHGVLLEDYLGFNSAIRHTDTDDNKIKSAKSNQLNSDASEASVNDDYEADNEDDGSDET